MEISLTKQEAIDIFGGRPVDLAAALGVTRQAINGWPDVLTQRQIDRVLGAAYRHGKQITPAVKSSKSE